MERLSGEYAAQAWHLQNKVLGETMSMACFEAFLQHPNQEYLVLLQEEKVVGLLSYIQTDFEAELLDIAVEESMRGLGFGKALLMEMLHQLQEKGIPEVFLEVRKSNAIAKTLYRSFGFLEIGVRKEYYSHPVEDAVLMKKILK